MNSHWRDIVKVERRQNYSSNLRRRSHEGCLKCNLNGRIRRSVELRKTREVAMNDKRTQHRHGQRLTVRNDDR